MQNKQIIFTAVRTAEYLDVPMPELTPDGVLVRLAVSTISSGTERANVIGNPSVNTTAPPSVKFPRHSGYSSAGTVEAVGEKVTSVKVGDRVALSWSKHARFCVIPEANVYKLPDGMSFEAGALIHIATFPLAAVRKCRLEIGESAIVMGLGVLGLIAVQLLKLGGAVPIIAVDPNPERRAQAISFGADYALDPFAEGFSAKVKELTNGGAKTAIEVTGNGQALDMLLDCMAKFGRVALLGCTRESDFTIDYYRKVHSPGITLIGAHTMARPSRESSNGWWTQRDDANALIALSVSGRLDLSAMIEDTRNPSEAPEVYTRLCNERSFPVTQFDWKGEAQ